MKQFLVTATALTLIVTGAIAQDDVGGGQADLVKRKAQQIRSNNNQQQGVGQAGVPAPPPGGMQPPAALPPVTASLNLAPLPLLEHFGTDAATIKPGTSATPAQVTTLGIDITALVKGATKPSKTAITKLATDLGTALSEKTVAAKDTLQLAKNLNVVLNSAPIPAGKAQPFVAQAQSILKNAGISQPTIDAVGADLKSILTEIQQSKPKLYQ